MTAVTEKAMLARLKVSWWGAAKHDKDISEKVAKDYNANPKMGRYSKKLIAAETLDEIRMIARRARRHHYANTLPWLDDGSRILPAASYFDYMTEQNAFKAEFERLADQFADEYPEHVEHSKTLLGKAFKAHEYPGANRIRSLFGMNHEIEQMPSADDFRVAVSEEENARIREQIQARMDAGVQVAVNDLWGRINEHVTNLVDRLRAYDTQEDGKTEKQRDKLVKNTREAIKELVDVLPKLNITGSNALEEIRHKLDADLSSIDPHDPASRDDATKKAEAILADVADFMA